MSNPIFENIANRKQHILNSFINNDIQKANSVGDEKVDKQGRTLIFTEHKPGQFDWRIKKNSANEGDKHHDELKTMGVKITDKSKKFLPILQKYDAAKLVSIAEKPDNDPELRTIAHAILKVRGEDVSGIDMENGRLGLIKQLLGSKDGSEKEDLKDIENEEGITEEDIQEDQHFVFNKDSDEFKKRFKSYTKAKGFSLRSERVEYDRMLFKEKMKDPDYVSPAEQLQNMNSEFLFFLESDQRLCLATGGAGVGKSYGFHKVAEALQKKQYDPQLDNPDDQDYDYVEVSDCKSESQLISILQQYNGHTILFDDSDTILGLGSGLLKKATATSGKRMVGYNSGTNKVKDFEFTGSIVFLSNMDINQFKNGDNDMKAIYSRALSKANLDLTVAENFELIKGRYKTMQVEGCPPLENVQDNLNEREEVLQIIADNLKKIDPGNFSTRTFGELLIAKRGTETANDKIKNHGTIFGDLLGKEKDWKKKATNLLVKAEENELEVSFAHFLELCSN